jgi:hypothetical protein
VPFHTTTELLLKLPPFTVRTKPAPPAVALLGESELTDGVDGQEQETTGSRKIANAPKRADFFIVAIGRGGLTSRDSPRNQESWASRLGLYGAVTVTWIEFEVTMLLPLT